MTLEDKLRAYAAKGELVHISLASCNEGFRATYTAASPAAGFTVGVDGDPVAALEKAFQASPIKPPRIKPKAVTAAVTEAPDPRMTNGSELDRAFKDGSLASEWTTP